MFFQEAQCSGSSFTYHPIWDERRCVTARLTCIELYPRVSNPHRKYIWPGTIDEFVVDVIDRMVPALLARCYKSRESNPRVPLGAVRALQNERTENTQRRYLRPEGLLKLPDMLISPNFWALPVRLVWYFLFYIPIRVCQSRTVSSLNGRNDFSNAMLFAFCNDNGK